MLKTEADLRALVKGWGVSTGAVTFFFAGSAYQVSGIPDCSWNHVQWKGWLELKGFKTKLEPIQRDKLIKLETNQTPAFVMRLYNSGKTCWDHGYLFESLKYGMNWWYPVAFNGWKFMEQLREVELLWRKLWT